MSSHRQSSSRLSLRDALLALVVVFVWGTNFVVIKLGLDTLPPLLFAALRFLLVLLPLCFFIKRPMISWGLIALYGVGIGLIQFGLLFIALRGMITPGLASLVVQMQVFFTVGIAMARQGERLAAHQIAAFVLALAGMGLIAMHNGHGTTTAGMALVLGAAMGWAISNQAAREAARQAQVRGDKAEHAGACGVGQRVRGAATVRPVAAAGRAECDLAWPATGQRRHLGGGAVAIGGQHHVRLQRVGVAAGALSCSNGVAAVAAGTGVRFRLQCAVCWARPCPPGSWKRPC